jgi:hypothetical protein
VNLTQMNRRVVIRSAAAFACLMSASTLVLAQDIAKPEAGKWRPRDGLYAGPGNEFVSRCGESSAT